MFGFFKLIIFSVAAFTIYSSYVKYFPKEKQIENKTEEQHQCRFGSDKCKLCPKKKRSLFDPPQRREIVFHLKEGQVLEEHQVLFNTPEGKELYRQRVAWLTEVCDEYAEKIVNMKNNH